MNNAIVGLTYDAPKGTPSFRVVSNDRNACPRHYGVFLSKADAVVYADETNAEAAAAGVAVPAVKVVRFKVRVSPDRGETVALRDMPRNTYGGFFG